MAWDLYQTGPLARLRGISLSSTPSIFAPHGMAASRFQHSVGVSYLARLWSEKHFGAANNTLVAAALCHDTGSPPFSHIAEIFSYDLLGKTHEQLTADVLADGSEIADVLTSYEVNPREVVSIVNGHHDPFGPLMAGSIDLDNIDNSLHLLVSLGFHERQPYDPVDVLDAIDFVDGHVVLKADHLKCLLGWAEARRRLYDILHAEPNLSAATMLYRALEFAYDAELLDEAFFNLTEPDALYVLRERCGRPTKELIDRLIRWGHFPIAFSALNDEEDLRLVSLYEDWSLRKTFTDNIATELGLPSHDLSLYVGRDRGEKNVTLPFIGDNADSAKQLLSGHTGKQRLSVFAAPNSGVDISSKRIGSIVDELIADLPESDGPKHAFY